MSGVGWRVAAALTLGMLMAGTVDVRAAGPSLILTPSQGTPAQVIRADGAGFCPAPTPACGTVSISFQGFGDVVRNIQVGSSGTFTAQFQPPAGAPGTRIVTATQKRANGDLIQASTTFTLTLQPSGATPPPRTPAPSSTTSPAPAPTPAAGPTTTPAPDASASPSPSSPQPAATGGGPTPGATSSGQSPLLGVWPLVLFLSLLAALALGVLGWRLWRARESGRPVSESR
jgi:hypothetical protein